MFCVEALVLDPFTVTLLTKILNTAKKTRL